MIYLLKTFNKKKFRIPFIIILIIVLNKFSVEFDQILRRKEQSFPNKFSVHMNNACSVFNRDAKQFYVEIDGITYPNVLPLYHNKSINLDCIRRSQMPPKTILLWNKIHIKRNGRPYFDKIPFGFRKPFEYMNCPVTNCILTNDTSKINVSNYTLFFFNR
jgi:hypothetical protein